MLTRYIRMFRGVVRASPSCPRFAVFSSRFSSMSRMSPGSVFRMWSRRTLLSFRRKDATPRLPGGSEAQAPDPRNRASRPSLSAGSSSSAPLRRTCHPRASLWSPSLFWASWRYFRSSAEPARARSGLVMTPRVRFLPGSCLVYSSRTIWPASRAFAETTARMMLFVCSM